LIPKSTCHVTVLRRVSGKRDCTRVTTNEETSAVCVPWFVSHVVFFGLDENSKNRVPQNLERDDPSRSSRPPPPKRIHEGVLKPRHDPLKSPRVVNPRASVPGPVNRPVHRAE
jgi:hypothetical protein